MRTRLLVMLMLLPCASWGQDLARLSFLEQEVRNLQRQVMALTRQMDELRTRPNRPPAKSATRKPDEALASDPSQWVAAGKWSRLRNGMSELEVIELLGPPTSMRQEDNERVLLYAMEIGASGFLGGSVRLRDRAVVDVRAPTLQ